MKNIIKKLLFIITVFSLIALSSFIFNAVKQTDVDNNITIVKNIINLKNENVNFVKDSAYIFTKNEDEYIIFDLDGNPVYSYLSKNEEPIYVSKKYLITKEEKKYVLRNKKDIILTSENLEGINDNILLLNRNIIDFKGNILLENVEVVCNKENYIGVKSDDTFYILNKKGDIFLENYEIVYESNNKIHNFLIVKNIETQEYKYLDLMLDLISNKSFYKYEFKGKNLIVYQKDEHIIKKYIYRDDNNLKELEEINIDKFNSNSDIEIFYEYLYSNNQENVLALNKNNNSFGTYNIKNKKFKMLTDSLDSIEKLSNKIYIINEKIVFDLNKNKIIYKNKNIEDFYNLPVYKVVKISNEYQILSNENKQLYKSERRIYTKDSLDKVELNTNFDVFINENKIIKNLKKVNVDKNYFLINENNIYDMNLTKIKLKEFYYTSKNIIKLENGQIIFLDLNKNRDKIYSLEENEKYYDSYKNIVYIYNEEEKYLKIVNNNGKLIKKINNISIEQLTNINGKGVIIAKKEKNETISFGAYTLE